LPAPTLPGGVPLSSVSGPPGEKPGKPQPGPGCPHHGAAVDNAGSSPGAGAPGTSGPS